MKTGLNPDGLPAQPSSERKFVVKVKTFGRVTHDPTQPESPAESSNKYKSQQNNSDEDKFADILEKSAAMRHLEYEIIEDAKMIQIKVVNTDDGEIIRKIPPDKVVGLVRKIRQNKNKRLDIKA